MTRLLRRLGAIKKYAVWALVLVILAQVFSLVLPLLMSMIINNGIANSDMDYIKRTGMLMIGVSVISIGISCLSSYFSSKTATSYSKILRRDIFLKVESLSQCDIDQIGTPSLITRCTNDVNVLQDFVLQGIRMIISAPIMLVGGTIMAFIMNARLALIIFAIIPLLGVIAGIVIKIVMPLFKKRQKMTDEVNKFLREKLTGIRVIRAFNRSDYEDSRFDEKNHRLSGLVLKFSRTMSVLIPICMVLVIAALDLIIYIATKNIDAMDSVLQATKISNMVGDLQAFVIYMIMIVFAVSMAAAMFVIVPRANISAKRILEVLDIEPMIKEPENPQTPDEDVKGEVEFRNVEFGYPDAADSILSDISFKATKGKVTAIIGGTGSGKSTLIELIPRFYDVTGGEILFDKVNVKDMNTADLHSRIGFVMQKACLFSGSIKENLLYGDENADESRLKLALDVSQSSEFVDELSDGIDSFVSQNGTNLSGGQKQRLSIARALTRQAEVYIFDDSFSALDFKTDAMLRKALKENIDATVIIVAQRVGTILDADQIIVLDEGRVAGIGTHSELLESCDVYKEIVTSQLTKEEAV